MIPLPLAFMALAACAAIYNTAAHASPAAALQLAVMLALGFVAGVLWSHHHAR